MKILKLDFLKKFIMLVGLVLIGIPSAFAVPVLANPSQFKIELFADFNDVPGGPDSFKLHITSGENGFSSGLYVTGGPGPSPFGERLFRLDSSGNTSVVEDRFNSNEAMVFAQGAYGDGILITEPRELRIRRLLSDGTLTTFANLGTAPFGPADLTYGADGFLYVTDFTSGDILRVNPDGSSSVFTSIPVPPAGGSLILAGAKPMAVDLAGLYGGAFVTGIFTLDSAASGLGTLFSVSADGTVVNPIVSNLDGIEFLTPSPGGIFGSDFYVSTVGTTANGDGVLSTLAPNGTLIPFLTGIDPIHVAFDTEGVLGGGMFISDLTQGAGPGMVWHVTVIPEPSTYILFAVGILGIIGMGWRQRKKAA